MASNWQLLSAADSTYSSSSYESSSSGDETYAQGQESSRLDLSYSELDKDLLETQLKDYEQCDGYFDRTQKILLYNNQLTELPPTLCRLRSITLLDLSNNQIRTLPESMTELRSLTHLYLRNNLLGDNDLPKDFGTMRVTLRDLDLSGNKLTTVPPSLLTLHGLRNLYVGGNDITHLPRGIKEFRKLRVFYLGGNKLRTIPDEISQLGHLIALILADNRLECLPEAICDLKRLQCLRLHHNRLTTLPHNLVQVESLRELSLRDNPLVVQFVREMVFQPSSLVELAARVIKVHKVPYQPEDIPVSLHDFMSDCHNCVNPTCKGVYFNSKVEHVKFVDFCGKYRVPLMQYICSSRCHADKPAVGDPDLEDRKMKRVLLG